jgi:hypothetical protein
MALIIEDGTGVVGANSYVSVAEFQAWLAARGYTITGNPEQLLLRAMDYIESLNYWGMPVICDQDLAWPRAWVPMDGCCYFNSNQIPEDLKTAQMQVARSIDAGVDPLSTLPRLVSSVTVGPISVTYEKGSTAPIIRSSSAYLNKLVRNNYQSFSVSRGS